MKKHESATATAVPAARWGEVIAAGTTAFEVQCFPADEGRLTLPQPPAFGSFVRAVSEESGLDVFAIVYDVVTGSIDSTHRPAAMNMSRQELREQQPQIFDLLRTDVTCLIVGYRQGGRLYQQLPPHPPQIHDFVYVCPGSEVMAFTERLDFLRPLIKTAGVPADELVPACLRQAGSVRSYERGYMVQAGKELSNILKDDYDRLVAMLRRLRP